MVPAVTTGLAGAGLRAGLPDQAYAEAGAEITSGSDAVGRAEVVLRVQAPSPEEVGLIPSGATVVALFAPGRNLETVRALAQRGVTSHSLELLPRTTRAQ